MMNFLGCSTKIELWEEVLKKYDKSRKILTNCILTRNYFQPRLAYLLIQISFCNLKIKNYYKAVMYLEEAE